MAMDWQEEIWMRVLDYKENLLSQNVLFCRTISVPVHNVLRRFAPYRYVSALVFGPDDGIWHEIGIPFVESSWRDGSIDFHNPTHISDKIRSAEHGKVFGTYEGRTPVMIISDAELIQSMLCNRECFNHRRVFLCGDKMHDNMLPIIEGERWQNIRSLAENRFSMNYQMERTIPDIMDCASVCIRRLQFLADRGGVVKCGSKTFGAFTMDLIGRIMFGKPFENYEDPDNDFAQNAVKLLLKGRERILLETLRYPEFSKTPECCPLDPEAMIFFKQYIMGILQKRTDAGTDFLHTLELANSYEKITIDELYANCTILIALSHHPVSFVMAVACWEISRDKTIQDKLVAEIDSCLKGRTTITYVAVKEMKYLNRVIKEALRKYPPAVRVERVCCRDTTLDKIPVKRGTVVAIPIYTLHHDPKIFPEPLSFNPDRFAGSKAKSYGYNYLPFGAGHRNCLALEFALTEMTIFMAYLLSQMRLVATPDAGHLFFQSKKNILMAESIPFRVERRHDRVWLPEMQPQV